MYLKGIENCPDNSDLHNNYGVFLVDAGKLHVSLLSSKAQCVYIESLIAFSLCYQGFLLVSLSKLSNYK